jgi:hypothetical protein
MDQQAGPKAQAGPAHGPKAQAQPAQEAKV